MVGGRQGRNQTALEYSAEVNLIASTKVLLCIL